MRIGDDMQTVTLGAKKARKICPLPNHYPWLKRHAHRVERRAAKQKIDSGKWEEATYFVPRVVSSDVI